MTDWIFYVVFTATVVCTHVLCFYVGCITNRVGVIQTLKELHDAMDKKHIAENVKRSYLTAIGDVNYKI